MSFIQIGSKMLPAEPGVYYWSEWKREVRVYRKGRAAQLWAEVPGGIAVKVTPRIAGTFSSLRKSVDTTHG